MRRNQQEKKVPVLEKKTRYWCHRCKGKQLFLEGLGQKLTGIKQGLRSNVEFGNVEVICDTDSSFDEQWR